MDKDIIKAVAMGLILWNALVWSIFGLVYMTKKVHSLDFCQKVVKEEQIER